MKIKGLILNAIYFCCYYLKIFDLFYFITRNKQVILTYHNIISKKYFDNAFHLGVSHSDEVFEFQINEILKKRVITTELGLPKSVVISFDDGYLNNYSVAYPILNKYLVNAIFFITKNNIDGLEPLWIDKIMMWISYVPQGIYKSKYLGNFTIHSDETRSLINETLWQYVNDNYSLKNEILLELNSLYSFENIKAKFDLKYYKQRFTGISKEMLITMMESGNLLAYHSIDHDILSRLNIDLVEKEFKDYILEYQGVYNSQYNSYPFGGINEINDEVLTTSLKYFQCNFMNIKFEQGNEKVLSRTALPNVQNRYVLHAKLSGFEGFIKKFRLF